MLKLVMRIVSMLFLAAFVMLLLYPALHELGHAAAALSLGARVSGIAVFPSAHTEMVFDGVSREDLLFTAFSGSVFPMTVLLLPDHRRFAPYYIKLTVAIITAAGSLTSLIGLLFYAAYMDDAALVLAYYPDLRPAVFVLSALILFAALFFCVISRPLSRCADYLYREDMIVGNRQGSVPE